MIQRPRGTMDILPEDIGYWRFIEDTARRVAGLYGFAELRIPTFEATELYQRGVGGTTDVVQKEMYTFTDRDGRSLTLRPEGTAGVVRCILENGKCSAAMPLKLFYNINCFRYEKPQAGRSREFFQFGAELFGAPSAAADFTMISLANAVIRALGIKQTRLEINSIGCPECRPRYHDALKEYFAAHADALCPTCVGRLATNPLRILDCKCPECAAIAAEAPRTVDHLCDECAAHLDGLESMLNAAGIPFRVNSRIVRGLDYYTRTVYEFIDDAVGAQSTVCGGGRYDLLVSELGGPPLAGTGFAMGITRLILAMKQEGIEPPAESGISIYLAPLGDAASQAAVVLTEQLRGMGIAAECDLLGRSIKAQMKYADKLGAAYTMAIGDDELSAGRARLRRMADGVAIEVSVNPEDIAAAIRNK